jgi:DNA-binding NtrC family response regulator
VKRSGGHIAVDTTKRGSVFRMFLPRLRPAMQAANDSSLAVSERGGSETLLIAEDDDLVRAAARRILERAGYQVLEASSVEEALKIIKARKGAVDLLLADIVMPGGGGGELAAEVWNHWPQLRVMFMSGLGEGWGRREPALQPIALVNKPFGSETLRAKVREALDGPAPEARAK